MSNKVIRNFDYKHIRTFDDIPQIIGATTQGHQWSTTVHWNSIDRWYIGTPNDPTYRLIIDVNPKYQRGHVWDEAQRIQFIEYCLRGGRNNCVIVFNNKNTSNEFSPYELVDGKQRMTAIYDFMHDRIKVFGGLTCSDLVAASKHDKFPATTYYVTVVVMSLEKESDILRYYLDHNTGGTPHDPNEIARVKAMHKKALVLEAQPKTKTGKPSKTSNGKRK